MPRFLFILFWPAHEILQSLSARDSSVFLSETDKRKIISNTILC